MTDAVPWVKWRFDKWRGDEGLRMCSLAARGLWIELLGIMHGCNPYGHLTIKGKAPTPKQIAGLVGMTSEREVTALLTELEEAGVFSRSQAGLIYSRRLTRDNTVRETSDDRSNGSLGGNPNIIRGTVPKSERVRPYRRSDSPEKTERIFNKTNGRCHWCRVLLQRNSAGLDFFVVDHVIAVRDGGTNDEANLVAACSNCNGKRAVIGYNQPNPTLTEWLMSDGNPTLTTGGTDSKADRDKRERKTQEPEKESKQPRASSFAGMAGVTPDAETGRPTCNGWYLDSTRERIYEAARIDDTKWRGHEGDAITDWLISGIEPDTIVGAIRDCVARQGGKYTVPGTLKYFNGPVTDAHGRRPTSTRPPPILTCEGKAAP